MFFITTTTNTDMVILAIRDEEDLKELIIQYDIVLVMVKSINILQSTVLNKIIIKGYGR